MGLSSSSRWQDRLEAVKLDLNRLMALLNNNQIQLPGKLSGTFTSPLSRLLNRSENLEKVSTADADAKDFWDQLLSLQQSVQGEINSQLEILGGTAIARGLSRANQENGFDNGGKREAEDWINRFIQPFDLEDCFVLIGRGPLVDVEKRVVRLPFLDWDYWHIPLLARAIGRLACEETKYANQLEPLVKPIIELIENLFDQDPKVVAANLDTLLPDIQELWRQYKQVLTAEGRATFRANHLQSLHELANRQRLFLYFLFADQFATAVLGPAYAIPVFVLELDYSFPRRHELEDPDLIEGRDAAPRFLPAAVQRAAAILATLEAMDRDDNRPLYRPGPYGEIIQRLKELWSQMLTSTQKEDTLSDVRQRLNPWFNTVYQQVLLETIATQIKNPITHRDTEADWQLAQDWYQAFLKPVSRPSSARPSIHVLTTAMWLHRLDYPNLASPLLDIVHQWQPDQWSPLSTDTKTSLVGMVFQSRMDQLKNRLYRLANILNSEQIPEGDRAAVLGRFYRWISEQLYFLEQGIEPFVDLEGQLSAGIWPKLDDGYKAARPLQREALEFLGGLLVHLADLDREPIEITQTKSGPSTCNLADHVLRYYVRCTGVNWNARTVLGRDPFLEPSTDVVRIRFPDWSIWNLPLVAHEFGHIASLALPAFAKTKHDYTVGLTQDAQSRAGHLDEFFADIFATYTFGPAFACDSISLLFNPSEAFLAREGHPSHNERAEVILAILELMNERTRQGPWGQDAAYGVMIRQLREQWKAEITVCGAKPGDDADYAAKLAESLSWARGLYRLIDQYFRFGASYKPERWNFAQKLANNLLQSGIAPDIQLINSVAKQFDLESSTLIDILNALWIGRSRVPDKVSHKPAEIEKLTRFADTICRAYVQE